MFIIRKSISIHCTTHDSQGQLTIIGDLITYYSTAAFSETKTRGNLLLRNMLANADSTLRISKTQCRKAIAELDK